MHLGQESRLRGLLLAGLTLGALVVGGRWWVVSAPEVTPVSAPRATLTPTSEPSYHASARLLVEVEPETGRTTTKYFLTEPSPGTGDGRIPAGMADELNLELVLPRLPGTVRREVSTLSGGEKLTWDLVVDAGSYQLHHLCVGPRQLTIVAETGRNELSNTTPVSCDGSVDSLLFVFDRTKQLHITVSSPGSVPAVVGLQLTRAAFAIPSSPTR